jgi:hypothetical protein
MGTRNADSCRGLDRSEATQMTVVESVTPEGLRARATLMRESGDESCARHLELAADEIATLSKPKKVDDESACARSYSTALDMDAKMMRVAFYAKAAQKDLLGFMLFDSSDGYEFAAHVLKNYDTLEGIK